MERSEWNDHHRIIIKEFDGADISEIVSRFAEHHWPKPVELFEEYLREQKAGDRAVWVAHVDGHVAGYITLTWQSLYKPFADRRIPEVMDLNVLPPFRRMGVGLKLLVTAESAAATKSDIVGIGAALAGGDDGGYGAAQRLYVTHGYIPDGKGVTYKYQHVVPGNSVSCDDDLVLWFTRQLKRSS